MGEPGVDPVRIAGDVGLELVDVLVGDIMGGEAQGEAFGAVEPRPGEGEELRQPARPEEVTDDMVESMFDPLPPQDSWSPLPLARNE